ncbi:iron-containing alcohol dehydrogenase [Clostridium swellfunianum]|uniref:iron-containing alcohol dehydrogenase n=1 Tax=Clostridium swellfunianum TaxID=1367462 RepID=UPI002030357A|nr:iron-containing alcohol dehydrogenase [Clostridium swellfunianum]MCM0648530.1 iron-containing alcohol dehydrogenase [Clostridium swellfunianum]
MENFKFYNPTKLIFGRDTVKNIGPEVKAAGIKKVLLLYGKGSIFKNGVYDNAANSLRENGVDFVELGGVKANPVLSKVYEAVEVIKKEGAEAIVALGGGSVIDTSKAVAAGYYYSGDIWDMFEGKGRVEKALPIYTILTLSATGSEMNSGAVITKEEEKKKWSFGSPYTFPKVSIIDPTIQFSLPNNQTVNGAVDAMSHTFELYFDGTKNSDMQDELSEGIIRTVMKHVQILLENPSDYASRSELAWCSTLALNGVNGIGRNGGDWASHGIEHSLSAFYDIAHGSGLAIIFPAWMKYVYKEDLDKFGRFAEKIFNITLGTPEEKALKAIEDLRDFYKKIGAPISLKDIGVKAEDLEKLADNAAMSAPMGTLKKLQREDIFEIYKIALE